MRSLFGLRGIMLVWAILSATVGLSGPLRLFASGIRQGRPEVLFAQFYKGISAIPSQVIDAFFNAVHFDPATVILSVGTLQIQTAHPIIVFGLVVLVVTLILYQRAIASPSFADDFVMLVFSYLMFKIVVGIWIRAEVAIQPIQEGVLGSLMIALIVILTWRGGGADDSKVFWRGVFEIYLVLIFIYPDWIFPATSTALDGLASFGEALQSSAGLVFWLLFGMLLVMWYLNLKRALKSSGIDTTIVNADKASMAARHTLSSNPIARLIFALKRELTEFLSMLVPPDRKELAVVLALSVMLYLALGVVIGVPNLIFILTYGIVFIWLGFEFEYIWAFVLGWNIVRLPTYIFEIFRTLWANHSNRTNSWSGYLFRPQEKNDFMLILPFPYLSTYLVHIAHSSLTSGLQQLAAFASYPFQRWALQRTLRVLFEFDNFSFFGVLNQLLTSQADGYLTNSLLLAELTGVAPSFGFADAIASHLLALLKRPLKASDAALRFGFIDALAYRLTHKLRIKGESPYAPIAKAYLALLHKTASVSSVLHIFDDARRFPCGEEIYRTFCVTDAAANCRSLADIARCKRNIVPIFKIGTPLRPQIVSVFRCIDDATTDATALLNAEYTIARRDSLLKAQGILDEAARIAETVGEPDKHLLLQVIETWRGIFLEEGTQILEQGGLVPFPNPYVSGRALNPEDGRVFVNRRNVFREVEDLLENGESIAICGQRRIGKTSVLLHLQEQLRHSFLPVYIDLQSVSTEKSHDLFYAIANRIASRLKDAGWADVSSPDAQKFHENPFEEFENFLSSTERSLSSEKRVVIMLDEFEELEDQVKKGSLDERVYNFIRAVTQTNRRFIVVIAGRYTLRKMTRDYSHTFFYSLKPILISYLNESDARDLIIHPVAEFLEYDSEALDRIISITHGQPYLIQDLCHNIVTYLNDPQHRKNRVALDDVNAILEHTVETAENYFGSYVWDTSNQSERRVLAAVAELANAGEGKWVDYGDVKKRLGFQPESESLDNLVERDILELRNKGETVEYRFQIDLSRQWIFHTQPLARVLRESPNEVGMK